MKNDSFWLMKIQKKNYVWKVKRRNPFRSLPFNWVMIWIGDMIESMHVSIFTKYRKKWIPAKIVICIVEFFRQITNYFHQKCPQILHRHQQKLENVPKNIRFLGLIRIFLEAHFWKILWFLNLDRSKNMLVAELNKTQWMASNKMARVTAWNR